LIKSPYSSIQGYFGNKLTRTQNSLIFGRLLENLVYADVWHHLRQKLTSTRTKFDYDSFMIDALPLKSFPEVKFKTENKIDQNCLEKQTFKQKMELNINNRKFYITKSFNCLNTLWNVSSLSISESM
jgi:hypothetical protein